MARRSALVRIGKARVSSVSSRYPSLLESYLRGPTARSELKTSERPQGLRRKESAEENTRARHAVSERKQHARNPESVRGKESEH
eukprot:3295209-Rhodomonas_salina.2